MDTLGDRIRIARGSMSQADFAKALEISKGSLGFYERNENLPNSDVVIKICSITGVNLEWLLLGKSPMHTGAKREGAGEYCDSPRAEKAISELEAKVVSLEQELLEAHRETVRAYKLATENMQPETARAQKEVKERAATGSVPAGKPAAELEDEDAR